jgi:hypothetical protein
MQYFFCNGMQQDGIQAPLLMTHYITIINSEFYLLSMLYQQDIGTFFEERNFEV